MSNPFLYQSLDAAHKRITELEATIAKLSKAAQAVVDKNAVLQKDYKENQGRGDHDHGLFYGDLENEFEAVDNLKAVLEQK